MKMKKHRTLFFDGEDKLVVSKDSSDSIVVSSIEEKGVLEGDITVIIPGVEVFSYIAELPSRDSDELQALIEHEYDRHFNSVDDKLVKGQLIWDADSSTHSCAFLTAVPESVIAHYTDIVTDRRTHIRNITTSFDALRRHHLGCVDETTGLALVVGQYETFADLLVLENGKLLVQRSFVLKNSDSNRLQIEIDRSLLQLENQDHAKRPEVYLYGSEDKSCADVVSAAAIESAPHSQIISLVPESIREKQKRIALIKSYALMFTSIFLLGVLCVGINDVLYYKESQYLYFLEENIFSLGPQAKDLSEKMNSIAQSQQEAELQYFILSAISEISSCVPSDVGIDTLNISENGSVQLMGQTPTREKLFVFMEALEANESLSGVEVKAMPIQRMGSDDIVNYTLNLLIGEGDAQ